MKLSQMWDKSVIVEIDVDEGQDWDILDINEGVWLHLFSFFYSTG